MRITLVLLGLCFCTAWVWAGEIPGSRETDIIQEDEYLIDDLEVLETLRLLEQLGLLEDYAMLSQGGDIDMWFEMDKEAD
ncbi:hypothetical protein KAR10_00140 [bacterium]|nr:hypothetical protein [bacterium]